MRSVYKSAPELEKVVTQGTILCNCVAEKYNCDVWGVIVTPRCDLAHVGKVTHVHYVPVISFKDWYKIDGVHYLWTKALASYRRKIQAICKEHGFPTSKLKEQQLKILCESISDVREKDKFKNCIDNFYSIYKINPTDYEPSSKEKETLIENLFKGDIPAFYLIEDWRDNEQYMVVLLRDLKRLEYNVAIGLSSGIEEKTISDTRKNDLAYSVSKDLLYKTEAEIISPYVEQLMERFSYNFCRIGVDDMDESAEDILRGIIK